VLATGHEGYVLAEYLTPGAHPSPQPEDAAPVAGLVYAARVQEFLSLRVAPDGAAERVRKLAPGALLRVLDAQGEFARVQDLLTGARGYVMADYLVLYEGNAPAPGPEQTGLHGVLCREYVSLRSAPASDGDVIATLPAGTRAYVLGHEGDFARVRLDDEREGYILSEYLTPVTGPAPAGEGSLPETTPTQGEMTTVISPFYADFYSFTAGTAMIFSI
jgi:SH3-like domain-containing protein